MLVSIKNSSCILVWQQLWESFCKLSQCRCSLWLHLCHGLFFAVTLLLEPLYCCFYLHSKQIFYALFIFLLINSAFSSVLLSSIYDCYISSAVWICWWYRVVLSVCCWVHCEKVWERKKGQAVCEGERTDHLAAACWLCRTMKINLHILVWPFPCAGWKSQSLISMCFCF